MAEPMRNEALVKREQYDRFIGGMITQVIAALPVTVPDESLKRARARFKVAFSADAKADLVSCTPESLARAIVLSAMSGLYPGGPQPDVDLIPRRNKHRQNALEINWQITFRGYIRLARRAGWEVEPVIIYEGETFKITEGNNPCIEHERNIDVPRKWETIKLGYVRVFPVGRREQAKLAYLTKEEIQKRRNKAQDDSIWKEWPLEMTYKTLCRYAGYREMYPTDDPSRYAMDADTQAEIGAPVVNEITAGGVRTLEARLLGSSATAKAEEEGRVVNLSSSENVAVENSGGAGQVLADQFSQPAHLTAEAIDKLKSLASSLGVSWDEVVVPNIGPPQEFTMEGKSEEDLAAAVDQIIRGAVQTKGGKSNPKLFG